ALLVRVSESEWKAFSAVCTHLNCTVQYQESSRQIWCACHNGTYDLTGRVVSGPPPKPLEEFVVRVRGDELVISRRAQPAGKGDRNCPSLKRERKRPTG